MMDHNLLSSRLRDLAPSATLAISARAKQMKKEGHYVVNFSAGEPDFDTPEFIKNAAKKALDEGFTKYTAEDGIPELKLALSTRLKNDLGYELVADQICFSNGAKQAIYNAFCATLDSSDEVIIPAPFWVSFPEMVKLCDGKPVIAETRAENDYKLTPDELEQALSKRTRWLILNSPSNPTGKIYTREELESLAQVLKKRSSVLILSDETYYRLIFDGKPFASAAQLDSEIRERTLVIGSLSKTYSMTGWRLGYMAGDPTLVKACKIIQGQTTSNPNSITQKAAIEALLSDHREIEKMRVAFEVRRNLAFDLAKQIPGAKPIRPDGAFYLFCDFSEYYGRLFGSQKISGSTALAQMLLESEKVATVPGQAFGSDQHIRISFTTSEKEIEEGFRRIARALGRLC